MFGVRSLKILLAAAMVLLIVVLCSCSQLVTRELPLAKRLKEDVTAYLHSMAGNDVLLYSLNIDRREYRETEGTLDYECAARFAWDEFGGENENKINAHYALTDDGWTLTSIDTDIDPAVLSDRVAMHDLFIDTVDIPEVVKAALSGVNTVLSDKLLDFTAEFMGVVYRFPCRFTDFTMNGWEIAEDSGVTALRAILPQNYVSVPMVSGDETITLYVLNQTDESIYIGQGGCIGFAVSAGSGTVTLPAGITAQSSAEDVMLAYGIPDTDETTLDGRKITYQESVNNRVSFLFGASAVQIDLFTLQAQAEEPVRAALFDTWQFGFSLEGVDYMLPVRFDTLLSDGWEISGTAEPGDVIRWDETMMLTLVKGNSSVEVTVRNPSMGDLRLNAADVAGITLDQNRAGFALLSVDDAERTELTLNQPAEGVFAALGEPSRVETVADNEVATYAADNGRYLRVTLGPAAAVAELQSAGIGDTGSDTLNATALQVSLSGSTYTLPAAASEFQNRMWVPESGWLQPMQAGAFVQMLMENRRAEGITAYFVNTGTEIMNLKDSKIAGLYAGPSDVDMVVGRSLGKDVSVGEAFNIFGTPAFDLRDGDVRYLVYGTSVSCFLCVRSVGDVVDALWIVCFTYQ
ncbi:MAG: hypothetical protein ABIK64_07375 [Bacillota bacterium]